MKTCIYYAADTNSYPVQLIVFNQWGCADTVWRLVKVIPEYTPVCPNSFTPDGDGLNEFLTIQGTAIVEADMEILTGGEPRCIMEKIWSRFKRLGTENQCQSSSLRVLMYID